MPIILFIAFVWLLLKEAALKVAALYLLHKHTVGIMALILLGLLLLVLLLIVQGEMMELQNSAKRFENLREQDKKIVRCFTNHWIITGTLLLWAVAIGSLAVFPFTNHDQISNEMVVFNATHASISNASKYYMLLDDDFQSQQVVIINHERTKPTAAMLFLPASAPPSCIAVPDSFSNVKNTFDRFEWTRMKTIIAAMFLPSSAPPGRIAVPDSFSNIKDALDRIEWLRMKNALGHLLLSASRSIMDPAHEPVASSPSDYFSLFEIIALVESDMSPSYFDETRGVAFFGLFPVGKSQEQHACCQREDLLCRFKAIVTDYVPELAAPYLLFQQTKDSSIDVLGFVLDYDNTFFSPIEILESTVNPWVQLGLLFHSHVATTEEFIASFDQRIAKWVDAVAPSPDVTQNEDIVAVFHNKTPPDASTTIESNIIDEAGLEGSSNTQVCATDDSLRKVITEAYNAAKACVHQTSMLIGTTLEALVLDNGGTPFVPKSMIPIYFVPFLQG